MRKITLVSPMRQAWKEGLDSYIPEYPGLEPETGDAKGTLANARRLLNAHLEVRDCEALPNRPILITFNTGEEFLATGFDLQSPEFAQFVEEAGLDEQPDLIHRYLKSLPSDFEGPISWPGFEPGDI